MGYYGGDGARQVATVQPTATCRRPSPPACTDAATGLIDCGNWAESASWAVPSDAVSGIYFAKLVREDAPRGASHIVFIVRDDDGNSDLLFQTSDTTWQAYNQYGGNSLYVGGPGTDPGRAYKVSYNRPFTTRGTAPEDSLFNAEYPMVRWLERNGYDVSYFTGVDTDRFGARDPRAQGLPLGRPRRVLVGRPARQRRGRTRPPASTSPSSAATRSSGRPAGRPASTAPAPTTAPWSPTRRRTPTPRSTRTAESGPAPGATCARSTPRAPKPENALTGTIFTVNCGYAPRSRCRRPTARCASGATPASPRCAPSRPRR